MRSESELRWVRAKNAVGQRTKLTAWHCIVPGMGGSAPSPGVACETPLSGSLQFDSHQGVLTLDGKRHEECMSLALAYIGAVDPSPGPAAPEEPEHDPWMDPADDWQPSSRQMLEASTEAAKDN